MLFIAGNLFQLAIHQRSFQAATGFANTAIGIFCFCQSVSFAASLMLLSGYPESPNDKKIWAFNRGTHRLIDYKNRRTWDFRQLTDVSPD